MYTNPNLRNWQSPSEVIHGFLKNDESLLWSGQPLKGFRLQAKDAFLIPFSIFWCGFAVFWELIALGILFRKSSFGGSTSLISGIFPLFGLPFVIIGLYLLFGRFIVDAHRRKKTYYGVTEQRIIIIVGSGSQKVKSFDLKSLTQVSMTKKETVSVRSLSVLLNHFPPLYQILLVPARTGTLLRSLNSYKMWLMFTRSS